MLNFLKCLCLSIHSFCILGPRNTTSPPPPSSKFKDIMTSFLAPLLCLPSIVPDLLNHWHHSRSIFFPSLKSPLRSSHHLCGNPVKKMFNLSPVMRKQSDKVPSIWDELRDNQPGPFKRVSAVKDKQTKKAKDCFWLKERTETWQPKGMRGPRLATGW